MIEWNKVTWYSQLAAIVLFLIVFVIGFYIGNSNSNTSNVLNIENIKKEIVSDEHSSQTSDALRFVSDDYFENHISIIHPLSKEVISEIHEMVDEGFLLLGIEMRDLNSDGHFDLYITVGSGYPSYSNSVYLWNEASSTYINVTPNKRLDHSSNDLRFNHIKKAFCIEDHNKILFTNEYAGDASIYTLNGFNTMIRTDIAHPFTPEQQSNRNEKDLYCSTSNGWEIMTGV